MKTIPIYLFALFIGCGLNAETEDINKEEMLKKHAEGAEIVANEQDELSADVQQLVIEQTIPDVIELLSKVEAIMDETTDYLTEPDTGGRTIAAQTEIIEKIHEAAKAKQQKQKGGSGEAGSAMMDMMEKMMGKGEGKGKGKGKGEGKGEGEGEGEGGNKGGQGSTGESNTENEAVGGNSNANSEERLVPKTSGNTGKSLPTEFQSALDAYNRGMEELGK